ncbi:Phasin protein [Roseivivax lentus]|uniref:Phasin protein n=1 Tax=Roseivivax lentus TaxID=633194 RepID=A0A1N7NZ37_9RHOB|nr:phasin family protein [Roseivivax lentus]SIT03551.1 Phasin protein [Roseivivax lentus]
MPPKNETPDLALGAGMPTLSAAIMAVNPAATKAWMDLMSESAQFVTTRLHEDIETQKALLACRTPADLLRLQSDYIQKAIQQYTQEAQRLSKRMSKATEDIATEMKTGHARRYDDIPL